MSTTGGFLKRVLKRENDGTPIGIPGNMYLNCECGHKVSIPNVKGMPMTHECVCGIVYDANGWIIGRPTP